MIVRAEVNLSLFIVRLVIQMGNLQGIKALSVHVCHSRNRGKMAH